MRKCPAITHIIPSRNSRERAGEWVFGSGRQGEIDGWLDECIQSMTKIPLTVFFKHIKINENKTSIISRLVFV